MILQETQIPEEMKIIMRTRQSYDWDATDTTALYQIVFMSFSNFLGLLKSKENGPVALVVNSYKGTFMFAAIVTYHPNTDNPDLPGNWSLVYTLDEEDLQDVKVKHYSNDISFHKIMITTAKNLYNYGFQDDMFIEDATKWCIELIKDALDKNAKPGEVFSVEIPEFFEARVEVKDDTKIMSVEPLGKMKQFIKGDMDIEL